ncbi:Na+/H+ antiporter NhaA [Patulibacter sp.]|uniref:Na+/H+ antiporter NhaA n=1 Tax=Patulibacter sp. TaxID=1912859 RepID=UPI002722718E|nr:Na+/H+ antiporter NhaA [Patulibacter sp.]MDO9408166.1 Na+/H+ antiporter NhaA [Patulibacter sp.]
MHTESSPTPSVLPPRTPWTNRGSRTLRAFLRTETGSAGLLLVATLVALVWANSPLSGAYEDLWGAHLSIDLAGSGVDEDLRHWVNDGLMAFFFYVVGLEIRRELELGELRDRRAAAIPAIAAVAGMAFPALLYVLINAGGEGAHGWGIVMATDIAFVLGALSLLGDRVSPGVRVFLLTLAIVDDVGAIAVIAIFYSSGIDLGALAAAAGILVAIVLLRRFGPVLRGPAYLVAGLVLWYATLKSGIHPTIAGVAMGLITAVHPPQRADVERAASVTRLFRREPTPAGGRAAVLELSAAVSPNERFQGSLHPWTSYLVVPLFALANAGVPLGGDALGRAQTSPVTIGVIVGLVGGKALGISLSTLLAVRIGVGPLPQGMHRHHVPGAATLAGIGFTVSLFVAELAFSDEALRDEAKIGVLVASAIAAAAGTFALARRRAGASDEEDLGPRHLDPPVDDGEHVLGPLHAPHTLVVFGDYECPATRTLGRELRTVREQAGDRLRVVLRHLPNDDRHPSATLAAEAAVSAASAGRFAEMHERLLDHPVGDDLGPADLLRIAEAVGLDPDRMADDLRHHVRLAAVQADVDSAARSGVTSTPTLFLDGEALDGDYDAATLLRHLDAADASAR